MKKFLQRCRPIYSRREFRVVLVLSVVLGIGYSFVSPFLSLFGTIAVGMTPLRYGTFMTITTLSTVAIGIVLAHFSDVHFTRRTMLLLGGVTGVLGYVGYAYLRSFVPLTVVGSLVLGVSMISFSQVMAMGREHLTRAELPGGETAFYMNIFRMFFSLAWTIGPAIAAWVMVAYGFRGLFLSAAVAFAIFSLIAWFFVPPDLGHVEQRKNISSRAVLLTLLRPDVFAHFFALVLIFAASTIGMSDLPLLILNNLHGTEHNVGIVYSVAPVFELPLMLYFGMLATKIDSVKIMRLGMVIGVIYYALLFAAQAPWHIYLIQFFSAALIAVVSGIAITYFQNYLPHHPGVATNLYVIAQRVGSTLGYLSFGLIAEKFGYRVVFVFCTGIAAVALGLMFVPHRPDLPESADAEPLAA